MPSLNAAPIPRWKLWTAFATVYLVWGSTFLTIRIAVHDIPPFTLAALRFFSAGVILYALGQWRAPVRPTRRQWRDAFVVGGLLTLTGNAIVVWAEQVLPSGLAALMVGTVPLWMVCAPALVSRRYHPTRLKFAGTLIGFTGVFILVPFSKEAFWNANSTACMAIVAASLSWTLGTLYARRASRPKNETVTAGMEMIAGGSLLILASGLRGEWRSFHPAMTPPAAWVSLAYLIVFGSVLAFSAYRWLATRVSTAQLATYAYVNPVVAVLLGWICLGEPLTLRLLIGTAVIVGGVVLTSV